ncbi:DUF6414 family protein [Streptomyces globisporus]|uniref:DUF6414 family protein n=1 Tax=Streptomyces globisporus TaxID=1908 RepID=UPI0011DFCD6E|nr:hypothetical protein [Streptomyces globisporus]
MILRRFLYLDEQLVRESLAQADSGIIEEQTITRTNSKDGKLGGDLKLGPAAAKAEKGKVSSEEIAQVLKQTPESQFNRLYQWLEDSSQMVEIFAADAEVWRGLHSGEVVAVQCELEVPTASRFMTSPEEMEALSQMAGLFGQAMDEGQRAAFEGFAALSRSSEQRVVAIGDVDDGAPKIVSALKKSALRVGYEELENEATVVGILQKKIPARERHLLFNLPGMNLLPRAERRRMAQASDADPSMFIEGPLGIVTPLAIF